MANLKFLHGNTDITASVKSDSFSCENILCDNQLTFGSCNSARAQFSTITDLNLTGEQIIVQYGSGSEWANLGVYKVTYSSKKENSNEVKLTMYDCIKNADVDVANWYIGLTFPMTISAFRNALCTQIGLEQKSVTLVNDSVQIYETIAPSKLKATDVLRYIGEINGVFPHASRDGKLDWVSLGSVQTAITATMIHGENGIVQKSYSTSPISKLCIRSKDGDIGITVGTGANTYYVTANPLVYGMTEEQLTPIATNLYNKIYGISYVPTEMEMAADTSLEMGALLVYDSKPFYILSRSTSGLLFDKIKAEGNEYLEEDTSVETSLEQLRGLSNTLVVDINGVSDKVEAINEDYTKYTEFQSTVDGINVEIAQMQSQIDGSIELLTLDFEPTLLNYPYWDWTDLKADDTHLASDDLHYSYPATELQKHLRTLVYDTENGVSYRFVKDSGQFVWKEVEDTETALILSRLTDVEATTEGLSTTVSEVSASLANNYWTSTTTESKINQKADSITTDVASTYATKETTNYLSSQISQSTSYILSTVQSNYATKSTVESLSSRVNQTASSISAEVTRAQGAEQTINGKVELKVDKNDNDQIVSMLNASADEITFNGGSKIHLASAGKLIIDSGNFQLNENGNVTCTNANVSGTITSSNANITGGTINIDTSSKEQDKIKLNWAGLFESTINPTTVSVTSYKDASTKQINTKTSIGTNGLVTTQGVIASGTGSFSGGLSTGGNLSVSGNATFNGDVTIKDLNAAVKGGVTVNASTYTNVFCESTRGIALLFVNGGNATANKGMWVLFCNSSESSDMVISEIVPASNVQVTAADNVTAQILNKSVTSRIELLPIFGNWSSNRFGS